MSLELRYYRERVSIEDDAIDQVIRVLVVISGIERRASAERQIEARIPAALLLWSQCRVSELNLCWSGVRHPALTPQEAESRRHRRRGALVSSRRSTLRMRCRTVGNTGVPKACPKAVLRSPRTPAVRNNLSPMAA